MSSPERAHARPREPHGLRAACRARQRPVGGAAPVPARGAGSALAGDGVSAEISRVEEAIPPPPRSDRGWTLRFDAIHSDSIRSARFGKLLIIGKGHGTVGFLKQLRGGPSELFESEVAFADADTSYDGVQLLGDMNLSARFSYPRHYRDRAPGLAKLKLLHAQLEVDARSRGLRMDTDATTPKISSAPIPGRLQLALHLIDGQLQPGDRAIWQVPLYLGDGAPDRGVLALQLNVANDLRLQARLPPKPGSGSEVDADLHVSGRDIPFQQPHSCWTAVRAQCAANGRSLRSTGSLPCSSASRGCNWTEAAR